MSGLGRKEFNAGDVLLASEVQGYLQDQAVMVFDDATARGSAIPSPSEGMVTYDKATKNLEVFDGSSFLGFGGGKILQVVRATDTTSRSTTSLSFVDASISVTITPQKATSNLILIYLAVTDSPLDVIGSLQIADSSNVGLSGAQEVRIYGQSSRLIGPRTIFGYVAASTTSARTYKVRFARTSGTFTIDNSSSTGQLYAIEVAA
jgi:hypothetical protein